MEGLWKFNLKSDTTKEQAESCYMVSILRKLQRGEKLDNNERYFLYRDSNVTRSGVGRILGWSVDFRPHLNLYWVKDYSGHITEVYALTKGEALRALYLSRGCTVVLVARKGRMVS